MNADCTFAELPFRKYLEKTLNEIQIRKEAALKIFDYFSL